MRFLGRGIGAEVAGLSVDADSGRVGAFAATIDAQNVGAIVTFRASLILCVDAVLNIAQIGKAIIGSVAVDVVNLKRRQSAVDVEPHQLVRVEAKTVYPDLPVAMRRETACDVANAGSVAIYAACENPGQRVVDERFANALCGKIVSGHSTLHTSCLARAGATLMRFLGPTILALR